MSSFLYLVWQICIKAKEAASGHTLGLQTAALSRPFDSVQCGPSSLHKHLAYHSQFRPFRRARVLQCPKHFLFYFIPWMKGLAWGGGGLPHTVSLEVTGCRGPVHFWLRSVRGTVPFAGFPSHFDRGSVQGGRRRMAGEAFQRGASGHCPPPPRHTDMLELALQDKGSQ